MRPYRTQLCNNFFIAIALLAVVSFPLLGQSKVGTTIGQFLKIEPGGRNAAMGNASASLWGEAISAFYNPASLGRLPNKQVQFTHSEWLADINYNYLVVGIPISKLGSFMVHTISLNSGEIDVRTVEQPLGTGERYSVTNFALGVGYGLMMTNRVSVGVQVNYFRETIWHSSAGGFALNLGVQYQFYENGPILGASLQNFGPRTGFNGRDFYVDYDFDPDKYGDNDQIPAELRAGDFPLPTSFRVGLAYPFQFNENNTIILAVDALHPNDNSESLRLGAEWQLLKTLFLRGGYRDLLLEDLEGGLTLGAGLVFGVSDYKFALDYAWADYGRLENTQRFTVGFRF